jgi:tetratricopeptide (TPR) repeat protein
MGKPIFYGYYGLRALACGFPSDALQSLRKYVSLEPDNPDAHNSLGVAYLLTGNYDAARQEFEAALRIKREHLDSLLHLGDLYLAKGRVRRALEAFEEHELQAAGSKPEEMAFCHKAKALLAMGKPDDVVEMARQALASNPEMVEAYWLWGRAEIAKGDLHSVGEILERMQGILTASQSRWREEYLHHLQGRLALERGDHKTAIAELEQALALGSSERGLFQNDLGWALYLQGDRVRAAQIFSQRLAFNLNDAEAHWMLGQIHEEDGRLQEAVQNYSRFAEIYREADFAAVRVAEGRRRINLLRRRTQ